MPKRESSVALRRELERAIRSGRCVYCRRRATPGEPLTREHVIPRAKGGKRKDVRNIVPACAACNHRRGCKELVPFLLVHPRRISAFLDYLSSLSCESLRQIDFRVFSELYAAVWMLTESADRGELWRDHLKRICRGRSLHRRRYRARRLMGAVGAGIERRRARGAVEEAPSCPIPAIGEEKAGPRLEEPISRMVSRLLGILSLAWEVSADVVRRELARQHAQSLPRRFGRAADRVVDLDGWRRGRKRRRMRVDRRGGRAARRRRAA